MDMPLIIWLLVWFLIMSIIIFYNKIIKLRNIVKNAFADIDVWMKKRFELVWNLIETVKWYAKHEKETLEKLTKLRSDFMNAWNDKQKIETNNQLASTLKTFFAVSEKYPDLKASNNFLDLQKKLSEMEDTIAQSRRYYNATVRELNNITQEFPTNIIAKIFWFKLESFFEIENEEQNVPKVNM